MDKLERVKLLAEKWKQVDPKTVDINQWTEPCGTMACLAGHAAQMKEFNDEGFVLIKNRTEWKGPLIPYYKGLEGIEACEAFFGVGEVLFECRNSSEIDGDIDSDEMSSYELAAKRMEIFLATPEEFQVTREES